MAERTEITSGNGVPPASEQVHMPGASYLPAWTAFGITIALVGVLLNWVVFAIGAVIALVVIILWVKETREEISQLPLDH